MKVTSYAATSKRYFYFGMWWRRRCGERRPRRKWRQRRINYRVGAVIDSCSNSWNYSPRLLSSTDAAEKSFIHEKTQIISKLLPALRHWRNERLRIQHKPCWLQTKKIPAGWLKGKKTACWASQRLGKLFNEPRKFKRWFFFVPAFIVHLAISTLPFCLHPLLLHVMPQCQFSSENLIKNNHKNELRAFIAPQNAFFSYN